MKMIIDNIRLPYKHLLYLITFFFWFVNFWGSNGFIGLSDSTGYPDQISLVLIHPLLGVFLSPNTIALLLLGLYPLLFFPRKIDNSDKYILIISFITIILTFMNPNNSYNSFLKIFFSQNGTRFIVFLIVLYSFFTRNNVHMNIFFHFLLEFGMNFFFILSLFMLIKYIIGFPFKFGDNSYVILQYNVQLWVAIFAILSYLYYYILQKKKYLLYFFVFFTTILLSNSRSNIFFTIISLIIINLYINIKVKQSKKNKNLLLIILIIITSFFFLYLISIIGFINFNIFFNRIIGTFAFFLDDPQYSDSNHVNQSILVTNYLIDNIGTFWGNGMRSDTSLIFGSSPGGIHNSFVFVWAKYGIPMLIYLIWLLTYSFNGFIKNIKHKYNNSNLLRVTLFFLLFFIIAKGWIRGDVGYILMNTISISQFLLLFVFIRLIHRSKLNDIED